MARSKGTATDAVHSNGSVSGASGTYPVLHNGGMQADSPGAADAHEINIDEAAWALSETSERLMYEIDPALPDHAWEQAVQHFSHTLKPDGLCVLDVSRLSDALHSETFQSQERIWPQRFARLSNAG